MLCNSKVHFVGGVIFIAGVWVTARWSAVSHSAVAFNGPRYDDSEVETRVKLEVAKRLEMEIGRRSEEEVARRSEAEIAERLAAEVAKREADLKRRVEQEVARGNEAEIQQRVQLEVARQRQPTPDCGQQAGRPLSEQSISQRVDIEIARRMAKLPAELVSPDTHDQLMAKLLPDALRRWSCGRDPAEAERLLRQHPAMHTNLDGQEYFNRLQGVVNLFGWQRLENKTFLELGFGIGLMTALLRGLNSTVYATEIMPVPWTPSRHGPFFDVMLELAKEAAQQGAFGPRFDAEKAAAYGRLCGLDVPHVWELSTTMEQLEGVPSHRIDVSYSLAVLEHISGPEPAFKALSRVSRIGSVSCHQIDLRDHRDFNRPWEFFLLSDDEFRDMTILSKMGHPYFGNRVRLQEFMDAAALSGFQTVHVTRQHEPASDDGLQYATETLQKLRALPTSTHRYANWPAADFNGCTSNGMPQTGLFICFRYKGGRNLPPDSEEPPCGEDMWSRSDFSLR